MFPNPVPFPCPSKVLPPTSRLPLLHLYLPHLLPLHVITLPSTTTLPFQQRLLNLTIQWNLTATIQTHSTLWRDQPPHQTRPKHRRSLKQDVTILLLAPSS